jgi:hypothetical protein
MAKWQYQEQSSGATTQPATPQADAPRQPAQRAAPTQPTKEEIDAMDRVAKAYIRSTANKTTGFWASSYNEGPTYVIVGRGFSAIANFTTMFRSKEGRARLAEQPVVMIGFPDPWLGYRHHEMNQQREVMTLPAFKNQLGPQPPRNEHHPLWCAKLHQGAAECDIPFVLSNNFADASKAEIEAVRREAIEAGIKFGVWNGAVDKITWNNSKKLFVVHVEGFAAESGQPEQVIITARYVDICVGPGQSRVLPPGGRYGLSMPKEMRDAYENPGLDTAAANAPVVIPGSEYTRGNVVTPRGSVVMVQGGGPAAAQGVEEAFRMGAEEVVWVCPETFTKALIPNRRVDFLVQRQGQNGPENLPTTNRTGLLDDKTVFIPRIPGLWLATGCRASSIAWMSNSDKRALVTFGAEGTARGQGSADPIKFKKGVFDQIVIAQGREADMSKPGSPLYPLRELDTTKIQPLKVGWVDFPVGLVLEQENCRVRVLGASGLSSTVPNSTDNLIKSKDADAFRKLEAYQDSLPAQSRVFFQGVTLSAATIAYANGYFNNGKNRPNTNRNTATKAEMEKLDPQNGGNLHKQRETSVVAFAEPSSAPPSGALAWSYHHPDRYPYKDVT